MAYKTVIAVESLIGDGRFCLIKNRRYNEYFYAAMGFDLDPQRRQVFTWIPGWHDDQFYWHLERYGAYGSPDTKYKIKSVKFDEYLYAGADGLKFDDKRRRVLTWKPKGSFEEQCYWDIQPVKPKDGDNERYFTIRNIQYNEYFYAIEGSKQDAERRHVATWKYDPNHDVQNDHQSHWSIKCT